VKHLGWILDLYHEPGQMVVWLKKPDGRCVRLVDRWNPKLRVGGEYRELVDLACRSYIQNCRFVDKFERANDPEKSRVLEVEVESDVEASKLANRIQREGKFSRFRLYDVDVPSPQLYLYEKDLFPLALVEADQKGEDVQWSLRDSREILDYGLPALRTIRLDVKTRKTRKVQTFADELGSLQIKTNDHENFTIDSGGEAEKLLGTVRFFSEEDPDIVITEGGDSFIFPYLARRAHENGILDQLCLGRDISPLRIYEVQGHTYFSYGKILYRETAARLLGRLHVDDHNAFISADCGLVGLFEISRTCIMPLQRASRATIGTNMTSLQLYHAVKREVLIPWNKNQPEEWKDSSEIVEADRGGFIFGPATGIHDKIGELDFTSLYPTLMRDMNLSGETVNCKCCPTSIHRVPELDHAICSKRTGIVPQSLDILLRRRRSFKELERGVLDEQTRQKFDQRQSALKWILVCSFGYLGFKNARFGKIDAHIATCAFSRVFLNRAVALAQTQGFNLVHGIVDSMWFKKPGATRSDYEKLSALLSDDLGIPLVFEGQYKWVVFLNSKTDQHSQVLNRYYGIFQDGTLKFRGIDLRRHDTPKIVEKCQREMLTRLSTANSSQEFKTLIPQTIATVRRYVLDLRSNRVPIEELAMKRSLSKNPNEYSHKVPQAIAAQLLKEEGGWVHAGQQVCYVMTIDASKNNTPTATALELVDENTVYDSQRYIDLLISSAANLLLPLGYDKDSLASNVCQPEQLITSQVKSPSYGRA
jgi:DNA polymerase elongation subunit (family B)